MLKRQRAPSPSPSLNSDMQGSEGPLAVDMERKLKRRRIAPPPLDGALRGWADPPPQSENLEMEDEDEWDGVDEDVPIDPREYAMSYTSTNKLLHELHIAHQHRISSNPTQSKHIPPQNIHIPIPPQFYAQETVPHSLYDKTHQPLLPDYVVAHPQQQLVHGALDSQESSTGKDAICAQSTYEHMNRSLKEAFLSRRRELGMFLQHYRG